MATTITVPSPADQNTTMLLLASADHNIPVLTFLLKTSSPNVRDPDTRRTPLHVAITSCTSQEPPEKILAAEETLKLLLMNGAIWNELDCNDETPGCIAQRLGLAALYEVMVQAGVRAELIFGRLDGYQELFGGDGDGDGEEEEGKEEQLEGDGVVVAQEQEQEQEQWQEQERVSAEAMQKDVNSRDFLQSSLTYLGDRLVDQDSNGVMMEWERRIMQKSCEAVLPGHVPGRSVLNVGFGMGIIDGMFREKGVARHVIVEPHMDVLRRIRDEGWDRMVGVEILEGRWQDVLPELVERGDVFDGVYFDTFAEDYSQLKAFFSEYIVSLLSPDAGRFSFFHGLGADRKISYDVYTRVVEMDLFDVGLETTWEVFGLQDDEGLKEEEWKGIRRKYWTMEEYKLPVCVFMG